MPVFSGVQHMLQFFRIKHLINWTRFTFSFTLLKNFVAFFSNDIFGGLITMEMCQTLIYENYITVSINNCNSICDCVEYGFQKRHFFFVFLGYFIHLLFFVFCGFFRFCHHILLHLTQTYMVKYG